MAKVRLLDAVDGQFLLLLDQIIGIQKKHIDADGANSTKPYLVCLFLLGHLQRMGALTPIVDGRAVALARRHCQGSALNFLLHAHGLC